MLEDLRVIKQCPLRLAINNWLLKKYNRIWKRVQKLLKLELDSKPVYGDDDKYIKTKIKIYGGVLWIQIFRRKKCQKKKHHAIVYQ